MRLPVIGWGRPDWFGVVALGRERRAWATGLELFALALGYAALWHFGGRAVDPTVAPWLLAAYCGLILYFGVVSPCLTHGDSLAALGLGPWRHWLIRRDNLRKACGDYAQLLVVVGPFVVLQAVVWNPSFGRTLRFEEVLTKFCAYLGSATCQDYLVFSWGSRRLREHAGAGATVLRVTMCAATLFALGHLPNVPLMGAAFVWAWLVMPLWLRRPNLWVLVFCHATLGTLLHRVCGMNMRVGPGYYHPDAHFLRELLPLLQQFMGTIP